MKHLWEVEHDYYCEDYNYRAGGSEAHLEYDTWQEFLEEMGEADLDMNLLFRWDWQPKNAEEERKHDELHLYYMMQRKGDFRVFVVNHIKRSEEADVIDFLKPRLAHLQKLWSPLV